MPKAKIKKIATKKTDDLKDWQKKEAKRIEQEFKEYGPDLKSNSKKSTEHCAITCMTLAHHGTLQAIEALKKFKKDPRAPMWIDCAIDECEMMLWDDTVGIKINKAEEKLRKAAQEVFTEKLIWDKEIITGALKAILTQQKIKFTYHEPIKLYFEKKVISEDKAEFIIDDVLFVEIKPSLSDWIMRFKNNLEGKDLRKGDLENIEQSNFNEFYENLFQGRLQMSKKPQGILLDFSGKKLYGKYFSLPQKSGWETGDCSGWCEGCFQEAKCETAQEFKIEEDQKRYRILKKLLQDIKETKQKIEETKRPSNDLEYQIKIAEKIKNQTQQKLKTEKDKQKKEKLKQKIEKWRTQIMIFQSILPMEQIKPEELEQLQIDQEMYQTIKEELETKEYKKNILDLETNYDQNKPKPKSLPESKEQQDESEIQHNPICESNQEEPLTMEEENYQYDKNGILIEDIPIEDIPF